MNIPLAESTVLVIVSGLVTGGTVWGMMRSDLKSVLRDVGAVKRALGLELVNGKIETAFVSRDRCELLEGEASRRMESCEGKLDDHEHRLTAVETRIGASG